MTAIEMSGKPRRMSRPKKYVEEMLARFVEGTFGRIAAVLREDEDRADLVREAVEKEIERRRRQKSDKRT